MLTMLLALTLAQTPQPDPAVWNQQATACMGSARATGPDADGPQPETLNEDALIWGLAMASAGPAAGRTAEADQAADAAAAETFFRQVRAYKPEAMEAHRAWCRAIRP
jgi:hypothetical protein